jgi:hypothetical protein
MDLAELEPATSWGAIPFRVEGGAAAKDLERSVVAFDDQT